LDDRLLSPLRVFVPQDDAGRIGLSAAIDGLVVLPAAIRGPLAHRDVERSPLLAALAAIAAISKEFV